MNKLTKRQQEDMDNKNYKVFEINFTGPEEYIPYLFFGPESMKKEAFRELCDAMTSLATEQLIQQREEKDGLNYFWIGWPDIVEETATLLEGCGFVPIVTTKRMYNGDMIIGGPFDQTYEPEEEDVEILGLSTVRKILAHNEKMKKDRREKREKRKEE